ncbi:hypothetical protein Mal52_35500 [Symmachiella dynata]|uniref:Gfo/Idh/MocA-like oxidoreductase N-terminal domain-containing protein n=1 Tax=Symmachiella dynata TaxID=2527995 RepID=A0A517ZRE9_9PLAN|nr:hypothetical protein [Symmachiella dynata]QDU45062.1 hypothetical protein Mal52_35500 [Symmachiella dynata]
MSRNTPASGLDLSVSRRRFLQTSLASGLVSPFLANSLYAAPAKKRPKVAVVYTAFAHRWHTHVLLENFLESYIFNGELTDPGVEVVSLYADQHPQGDMTTEIAKNYGLPVYDSISDALCLGGKELAVDAVLSIGEHGSYPKNDLGQVEYPRKRFFDEIAAVMKRSQRFVPVFNDKHLSYRWDWAKEMYDTSVQHGIPFMAGSSVPLAQRAPMIDNPIGVEIEEAISIHGGGVESYDFHGLEVLQSMVEGRRGGETGIARVQFLSGDALMATANKRWSVDLAAAAMQAEADFMGQPVIDPKTASHGILLEYKDGLRATVLKVGNSGIRWNFACRVKGEAKPVATYFNPGPWDNRCLFKALSHAIQNHFIHGKAPYPVERTLMTTGVLDSAMHSRHAGEKSLATPQLEFAYQTRDYKAMRETGASWKIIKPETPQPMGIASDEQYLQ